MKKRLSEYTENRNNNFNLIRFLAAALVLCMHGFVLAVGNIDLEKISWFIIRLNPGGMSVDIFFITSGFLIYGSIFRRKSILYFIWARVLRIYPALIVSIIFCTFIVGLFFTKNTALEYLCNYDVYKFFIKNITLIFGVEYQLPGVFFDNPYKNVVNGSIWTLPYEVEMYVCLATISYILMLFEKWFNTNIIKIIFLCITIAAISLEICYNFKLIDSSMPWFVHLFSMFFIGVSYYICRENIYIYSKLFFLLVFLITSSFFLKEAFFIVYYISLPYLLFYLAYVPSGKIRMFNKIGDYSYGMYIYAFPVQQSIVALTPNISIFTMIVSSFFITLILAFLSWNFIEKKALEKKDSYITFKAFLQTIHLTPKST